MIIWKLFTYIDWILFLWCAITVLYLGVFAFTSLWARHSETPKAKNQNRFIILIPSHRSGKSVEMTVNSILGQTYPQRLFDVTVIADKENEITMFHLAQQPITLLTPIFAKSSRTQSLQLAVNNLPQFKIYDVAIILDAGDIVEPEFLEQMNDAYESAGTKAFQAHKLSFNRDTVSARLSAIFEEINNSIFRRGHISIGLPCSMQSSGSAFDFAWLKSYLKIAKPNWSDKEMEAVLTRQHIFIDFFDYISVFSEKAREADDFTRQHRSWTITQMKAFFRNIRYLPMAIANRQYDMIDKLLQWMLIPRVLLMVIIFMMCLIIPFIYFTTAIKWWTIFAIVLFIFAVATPDYLVDDKWDSTFFKLPFVFMSSILRKFKLGWKIIDIANLKQ